MKVWVEYGAGCAASLEPVQSHADWPEHYGLDLYHISSKFYSRHFRVNYGANNPPNRAIA